MPGDLPSLAIVLLGALVAGFTTGFAGFGTALVAAGFWYHALPAPMVPPLVVLAAVAAHLVGLVTVRKAFDWRRTAPFLVGGALGVPLGVLVLSVASPDGLRTSVGILLVTYALLQFSGVARLRIDDWGGRKADGAVGLGGGFLGGFAGLSGPLPLVWLQLRGGPSAQQRAIYQPFNLVVLGLAAAGMAASGLVDGDVLLATALCLPLTLGGAWAGARVYLGISEKRFRLVILVLLLASGTFLVVQAITGS
ncbi:MAG: sulfite exporter TauE/SafE family protein [Alphaproteobacteria bacterium]